MEVGIQMMEEQIINFIKIIFNIAKKIPPNLLSGNFYFKFRTFYLDFLFKNTFPVEVPLLFYPEDIRRKSFRGR